MTMSDEGCQICTSPESDHDGVKIRHTFTMPGQRIDTSQFTPKRRERTASNDDASQRVFSAQSVSQKPFDPVLRIALVDAGVLTVQQIEDAERKIALMTADVMNVGPKPRGLDG
jgi:hypothetical protein